MNWDRELTVADAARLFGDTSVSTEELCAVADQRRKAQVGDAVTYVVNRNINFTNVCVKRCDFCAFSRNFRSEQGYMLPTEEVVRRATEAWDLGATEVCIQAGLAPRWTGQDYVDVTAAVKKALPKIHIHAWSPEEVKYGVKRSDWSLDEFLGRLRDAGLGSLPGTSAEILDDALRHQISPGRITTAEWTEIIETAHALSIPTTATMMFAHVETHQQRAAHLGHLRDIQRRSGGITEFVPLSFVRETPVLDAPDASEDEILRTYAVSRLFLGADIPNLQASWVKEGLNRCVTLLDCGVNDLGGTLINESISTSAGAAHGQLMRPTTLRDAVQSVNRRPVQRNTLYGQVAHDRSAALDAADASRFGSYDQLAGSAQHRFKDSATTQ
jgi:7,8-didemethyl-8-hydroxy-5-deazariboflavin synthase CofH subunit